MAFASDHVHKKHVQNYKSGKIISINVLEFLAVIINYVVALTHVLQQPDLDDPQSVLLNYIDNKSAL